MELGDITRKYSENLNDFFANSGVIDIIGEEQYGKESYQEQKAEFTQRYKDIMKNTVFIPYITLEHLEKFIIFIKLKYGNEEAETKFPQEIKLLNRLTNVKQGIMLEYTTRLIEEVKSIIPNHEGIEEILKRCLEDKTNTTLNNILLFFQNNKISKHQQKNICKFIENYKQEAKEKILLETSSYFENRQDIPDDKYYISLLDNMSKNGQFVNQQIGKESNRNCRYIFLPVLEYKTENDYLKNACHEVMHISKEKVGKRKYKTGLLERIISNNKGGELLSYDNPANNYIQDVRWKKLKKGKVIPESKQKYHAYMGEVTIEEVTHHWQVQNVVKKIVDSQILKEEPLYMINKEQIGNTNFAYENADEITDVFMSKFGTDIQNVNNGKMSIKGFKRLVGNKNFSLLGRLYTEFLKTKVGVPGIQWGAGKSKNTKNNSKDAYVSLAGEIMNDMAKRKSAREAILAKTNKTTPKAIMQIANRLEGMREKHRDLESR